MSVESEYIQHLHDRVKEQASTIAIQHEHNTKLLQQVIAQDQTVRELTNAVRDLAYRLTQYENSRTQ
jgi:uncharacterized coiled-coil protein SlyX